MKKKAQGILDYVWLLSLVIAALFVIGLYVRNSISGRFRETSDAFGQGEVYVPFGTTVTKIKENR